MENYTTQAKIEAIRICPKRKNDLDRGIMIELTAEEIIKEAEIIYQWMMKDI